MFLEEMPRSFCSSSDSSLSQLSLLFVFSRPSLLIGQVSHAVIAILIGVSGLCWMVVVIGIPQRVVSIR